MQGSSVEIEAVIFDWGGTLTPWRPIDYRGEALALAAGAEPERQEAVADAIFAAGAQVWGRARDEHRSATLDEPAGWPVSRSTTLRSTPTGPSGSTRRSPTRTFARCGKACGRPAARSACCRTRSGRGPGIASSSIATACSISSTATSTRVRSSGPSPSTSLRGGPRRRGGERPVAGGVRRRPAVRGRVGPAQLGMRTIWLPHSDIPDDQRGHTEGTPDATVHRLAEIGPVIDAWTAGG